jgi:cold shock CspA family protein
VYKFNSDCGAQLKDMLMKMEKLPFHSDDKSLDYNENFVEIKNSMTYSFEAGLADSIFLRTVPPTGPYARVPFIIAQGPRDKCKYPAGRCNEEDLMDDWDELTDEHDQVYRDHVIGLALKHNSVTARWVAYFTKDQVTAAWEDVVGALAEGKLGYKAMVSTAWCEDKDDTEEAGSKNVHRIMVYTHNYTDLHDVCRVMHELLDFESFQGKLMHYKLDCYQVLSITAGNPWDLSPNLCDSSELSDRRTGVCKFFDPKKGYGFLVEDNGTEVYVKAYDVVKSGDRVLVADEKVEYTSVFDQKSSKQKAILVCAYGGAPPRRARPPRPSRLDGTKPKHGGSEPNSPGSGRRGSRDARKGSRGSEPDSPADNSSNWRGAKKGSPMNSPSGGTRTLKPKAVNTSNASTEWQTASGTPGAGSEPNSARSTGEDDDEPKRSRFGGFDDGKGWGDDNSDASGSESDSDVRTAQCTAPLAT